MHSNTLLLCISSKSCVAYRTSQLTLGLSGTYYTVLLFVDLDELRLSVHAMQQQPYMLNYQNI